MNSPKLTLTSSVEQNGEPSCSSKEDRAALSTDRVDTPAQTVAAWGAQWEAGFKVEKLTKSQEILR